MFWKVKLLHQLALQKEYNLDVGENQRLTTLMIETMSVSHLSVVVFNFKIF